MIKSKGDIARLCIYFKKDIKVKLVNHNTNDSSAIWLEIGERKNKWLLCNYYREHSLLGIPGSNTPELQSLRFENFISDVELVPSYRNLIIIGDFNINLLDDNNGNTNEMKDSLLDRFPLLGLTQTVRNSTRHSENSNSSLIDHSWVSNMRKFIQTRNIESTSDHDAIITTVKIKGNVNHNENTYSRNLKNLNEEELKLDLMSQT